MKENKKTSDFSSLGSIVNDLGNTLNIEKGLKITSLVKMWPNIVGPRFEKTSKIFSVHENNGFDIIIVAVSSSCVSQELIFYKNDIMRKIHKTLAGHRLKIKDIQFSTKFWKDENEN